MRPDAGEDPMFTGMNHITDEDLRRIADKSCHYYAWVDGKAYRCPQTRYPPDHWCEPCRARREIERRGGA